MAKKILLLIILTIPAFALMLRPGIYTMHDFHVFRQYEFDKCTAEGIFPCRWAPDAGLGYGEPLFNYYGQFPYWLGTIFRLSGFPVLDSVKSVFILSLVLSGISMYLLAKEFWGSDGALVSALFYTYAPYRAVDVWVRGALPEALSFVFFPLILLFIEKKKYLLFSFSLFLLLITHNLSLFMFLPFMGIWWLVRSWDWKFIPAGLLSLVLSSFYLLPVIFESNLVTLTQTTAGYYDYSLHWTTLSQLFLSRFWGYGGSNWGPNDTMSFSIGHLHWIIALVVVPFAFLVKKSKKHIIPTSLFVILALIALFLTHGKSEVFWKIIPGLPFVQFPWRFLSMSTFFLSLTAGVLTKLFSPKLTLIFSSTFLLLLSANFFGPDIWLNLNDTQYFSGKLWDEQRSSALSDFWPKSAPRLPQSFAPSLPSISAGDGFVSIAHFSAHSGNYRLFIQSQSALTIFPQVFFPGWTSIVDGIEQKVLIQPETGLIALDVPQGWHDIRLEFKDSFVRLMGNLVSSLTLLSAGSWLILAKKKYRA